MAHPAAAWMNLRDLMPGAPIRQEGDGPACNIDHEQAAFREIGLDGSPVAVEALPCLSLANEAQQGILQLLR